MDRMLPPFNEIEIKQKIKKKSILSIQKLRKIHELFLTIKDLSRYEHIRNSRLKELGDAKALVKAGIEGIENISLDDFIMTGINRICDLPALTPAKLKLIQDFLVEVKEKHQSVTSVIVNKNFKAKKEIPAARNSDHTYLSPKLILSSVEAEKQIQNSVRELKSLKNFNNHAQKTVGEFWENDEIKAPFEECLTLKQICEINIENILKKKSFTPEKLNCLINALRKAVIEIRSENSEEQGELQQIRPFLQRRSTPDFDASKWKSSFDTSSLTLEMIINIALEESSHADVSTSILGMLIRNIPKTFSCDEFVVLWLCSNESMLLAEELLHIPKKTFDQLNSSGIEKIKKFLSEEQPLFLRQLQIAFNAPIIPLTRYMQFFVDEHLNKSFQYGISKILLYSLGGYKIQLSNKTTESYWTINRHFFQHTVAYLTSLLPAKDPAIREELAKLFPMLEQSETHDLLLTFASFDDRKKSWIAKH